MNLTFYRSFLLIVFAMMALWIEGCCGPCGFPCSACPTCAVHMPTDCGLIGSQYAYDQQTTHPCGVTFGHCAPCKSLGYPVAPYCPHLDRCGVLLCAEPILCTPMERQQIMCYLTSHGVRVVQVGETFVIYLSSDLLFYPCSTNIRCEYLPVLDAVSRFIFCYEKVSVRVAGYTDGTGPPLRNCVLTQLQAQRVARVLWSRGIDTRLLYAVGNGSSHPIASNATPSGRAKNRRIEITFCHIPPY